MRIKPFFIVLVSLLNIWNASAQDAATLEERIESAKVQYRSGMYYSAEQEFLKLVDFFKDEYSLQKVELEAYKLMCAINLDRINAEGLVTKFEMQYPNAIELPMVKYTLASHLFDKGQYPDALAIFKNLNNKLLYEDVRIDYKFKYGFCSMDAGEYSEAEKLFLDVISYGDSPRYYSGMYYLGYVYYRADQFEKAYDYFVKAMKDSKFSLMSSYFAIESKFMLKDYDYVIEHGTALYKDLESDFQSTLSRMISEAYYEKGSSDKALDYFNIFASSAELSRVDNYFGGILSYNTGNFEDAKNYFLNVVGTDDAIGQNAAYYTANAFLKEHNKVSALEMFKTASEQSFDDVIKEDALFNFAKLSFDVNNDISQFDNYLSQYPNSGRDDAINGYMAASFLLQKDYTSAITALKNIRNLNKDDANNLQKAAFFRGLQLVETNSFRSATPLFEMSLDYGNNDEIHNLAEFWLAECMYRNNRYQEAITIFKDLSMTGTFRETDEYPLTMYNLAYCYFKDGDFANAEEWFKKYLAVKGAQYHTDASIRLSDAYFMQAKYSDAARSYENIYRNSRGADAIYSAYQSAVSYGLVNNDSKKIDILRRVTRNNNDSPLYCQCLYELGRTYVQKGDNSKASDCFYTLVGRNTDSLYFSKALVELAMINSNNGKYDTAIDFYKQIIEQAPYSEEVQDAIAGMESIYMIQNEPERFLAFLDEQNLSNIKSEDEKEKMLFGNAEHLFLSRNYSKAITALRNFISTYPEGGSTVHANYYLAEALRAQGQKEQSADEYLKVIKYGEGDFLTSSLKHYAQINYEIGNYELAADVFQNLVNAAKNNLETVDGYVGMMRSLYADKKFAKAIEAIQKLGECQGLSAELQREAEFTLAQSYLTTGERDMAMAIFEDLAKDCKDRFGAESSYIRIQNAYSNGDFEGVEKLIYEFVDKDTPYVYWLAKGFIVLGDVYNDLGDYQQARATYQSIVEGYEPESDTDDVVEQVEDRLKKMEGKE